MTTVVDASIVVDWIAPEADTTAPAFGLLATLSESLEPLVAPRLLLLEIGNALLTGIRRGRWSGADADAAFAATDRLPIRLADDEREARRAFELSRRYDEHPIYDMAYVSLAERESATLVTADRKLLSRVGHLPFVTAVG